MAAAGRDRELGALASFFAERRATALLVEGEAGIGKTTVWRAGLEEAERIGYRIISCTPVQTEAKLSFTGLRDLLDDVFDEVADELPLPQQRALEITLLREAPGEAPPELSVIAVAFASALRALGAHSPTLVAVDDAQWLDPASSAPLEYALRRLDSAPVLALLARRVDEPTTSSLVETLGDRLERIELGPLSIGALGRVLHERLGVAFPRPVLHRIHQTSGGNPFFALELARSLGEAAPLLRPGELLPVPKTQRELVRERLEGLPAETLDALSFAAALSRPTVTLVSEALGRDAMPALDVAARADVAQMSAGEIRFAHPLFAAAVYELVEPRRAVLHERLAEIVSDPEERARHLALGTTEPDSGTATIVEQGAALAYARGSPIVAATLAAEARRLTEPGDKTRASRRALAEIDYVFAAGDTSRASTLLDELVPLAEPGPERARLRSRQARVRHFGADIASSVELLYDALEEAGDDIELRGEIEEGLAWGLLLVRRDLERAATHAESAVRLAEERGAESALAEACAALALIEFVRGRPWQETMEQALAREESTLELRVLRQPTFALGYCLSCADEVDRARACFDGLLRRAEERGDDGSVPSLLNHLTLVEWLAGRWDRALELADDGFERALESGQRPTQASILAKRALVDVHRGRIDEARSLALDALRIGGDKAASPQEAPASGGETAVWALGLLELILEQPDRAHSYLGPMCEVLLDAGVNEPGELRCLPDEVDALVQLGRLDEAENYVGRLEAWADRLGRPSACAGAGRARGALLAAQGDTESAISAIRDAASAAAQASLPFERARALLALGRAERQARQLKAARESLRSAQLIFEELGAELWADSARAELKRIGGRAASPDSLTPTEQRVAGLVSEGKSNKEVAAALVVSVHTVEATLTSIYRKLDVRSRTELARKLLEPSGSKH